LAKKLTKFIQKCPKTTNIALLIKPAGLVGLCEADIEKNS
jgi:hypothetical protein